MDKEEQKEDKATITGTGNMVRKLLICAVPVMVSLPGAGGIEPTILEVLNRNVIGDCDNESTDQQQQQQPEELHQSIGELHQIDDINDGGLDSSVQLDSHLDTKAPVTDLDVDDNENDNSRTLEPHTESAARVRATAGGSPSAPIISELESHLFILSNSDSIPSASTLEASADCDIVPVDSTTISESYPNRTLVNQRLQVVDNSRKRLSSVREQSNESESSFSDDSRKQIVASVSKESETDRPWYLDESLDPEDQRIIQEAVESILNDAKKQLVEEQANQKATVDPNKPSVGVISDLSPLHAPQLLLSSTLYQSDNTSEIESGTPLSLPDCTDRYRVSTLQDDSNLIQDEFLRTVTDTDRTVVSPIEISSHTQPEAEIILLQTFSNLETTSPDSGVQSLNLESNQITESATDIDLSLKENLTHSDTNEILEDSISSDNIQLQQPENSSENTHHQNDTSHPESICENSIDPLVIIRPRFEQLNWNDNNSFTKSLEDEIHSYSPQSEEIFLSSEAKKEYYQRLRDYLNNEELHRPPVPLKTYQWEDLRRAKKQGGYPWTHLYKQPLRPDEEPELISLRRSQERQKFSSESPRSVKKVVRIHEEVLVKETERYISDLSDNDSVEEDDRPEDQREEDTDSQQQQFESISTPPEDNFSIRSEPILSVSSSTKISRIKGILKRRLSLKQSKPSSAPESRAEETTPTLRKRRLIGKERIARCCQPIMNKLKSMADKQLKKRNIKKVPLKDDEKIVLSEKQKILKLKASPKADHGQIAHFIEKQDSDDVLEILELEESPSKTRKYRQGEQGDDEDTIPVPDEIIELPVSVHVDYQHVDSASPAPEAVDLQQVAESPIRREDLKLNLAAVPKKAPRKRKEHVYEDIDDRDIEMEIDEILQEAVQSASRISEQIEEEIRRGSSDNEEDENAIELRIVEDFENDPNIELKSALKREASPGADKRVTFSHTEDEAEPLREDIELPEEHRIPNRWSNANDHEYEPIGQPLEEYQQKPHMEKEASPIPTFKISEPPVSPTQLSALKTSSLTSIEQKELAGIPSDEEREHTPTAFEQQREIEERYFSSIPNTPRTDSRTDNEIHTSQVDSSALEELPLKAENRKKGFMASAQDRSRKVSQNIRSQAGKIRTKIRGGAKKPPSGSPIAKERRRFKKPDFSKIKMPEIKRPELPKFKTPEMPKFKSPEFKRPEFTKFEKPIFTKPDLSKFKIPDSMTIKLRRSRSFKESDVATTTTETSPESAAATPKKRFDFNFGTYPRMLRKRKQKLSTIVIAKADDLPSTETPPSVESTTLPRQAGGPVSPRWNEKFSDVSYGDSESGKYQRYGSEVESLGRESSIERRMREDSERSAREQEELEMIQSIEQKQFADFDEENRAIHEISKIRESEFKKRRPMVHQDSDLVSEESKDVGWSEKDAIRNAILRGAEDSDMEIITKPVKYASEEEDLAAAATSTNHETQSTASSGNRQKGVIEEIDDDEFILRKRGISQDNIEIRQYISSAIREGLTTPINTLAQLGSKDPYYHDMDESNEQVDYGYDVPPPKPKRAIKHLNDFDRPRDTESREMSQDYDPDRRGSFDDNTSLPQSTEGYFTNIPPNRPFRRSKKHYRRNEDHEVPSEDINFVDEDEDSILFKKMNIDSYKQHPEHQDEAEEEPVKRFQPATPPKAPKRRKKQPRESMDKDSYANRFSGRSVSNSFLPSEEREEDFIVYRTQHEYIIPLAQAETFSTPTPAPRRSRSRSQSRITDDDRTSRGADSLASETLPSVDLQESDGYATVRKDPPPRPPAPTRNRRASPLPEQHFSTMPHLKRDTSNVERPKRIFNTMGPSRPPRRKSAASVGETKKDVSSDVTQYEELDLDEENANDDFPRVESPRGDLNSGDVINKMKYRPLPPPPRPPRESRRRGHRDNSDSYDNKDDRDDGAERIACDLHLNGDYNVEKYTEKCIEVEVSTQTDPLPDDFSCEEFEITDDMRVIEPRVGRTVQDFLREEQHQAEREQDDESFSRSLQRFREAGQRSYSEKSRASTADRSKASHGGSRPTTPNAVVIERRIPTPIPNRQGETLLEASLLVLPVDDEDLEEYNTEAEKLKDDYAKEVETKEEAHQQEEELRLTSAEPELESPMPDSPEDLIDEIISDEEVPPPVAPPRKRSSITIETSPLADRKSVLPASLGMEVHPEHEIERSSPFPTRLALAELEVGRLNVSELQAGSITVSQLQSSSINTDELECRSSNLTQPIEFPPGLIDEIIERIRSTQRSLETEGTQTTEQPKESTESPPPPRPPLPQAPQQPPIFPSEYMQYSIPPPSFYELHDPSEADTHPVPTLRRRRHHRRRDSSSEESHREHHRSRRSTRSPEPTIGQLGGQLLQACGSSVMQSINHIVNILRANAKEGNDRNISTAIVLVILVTIGFLLLGITSNRNIHHHHWDYFNPPDNTGR